MGREEGGGGTSRVRTPDSGIPKSALDFVTSEQKLPTEKMERKPSLRCTLLLLPKWNRIPSADCQICSLSSFYPMTSMCGGTAVPAVPGSGPTSAVSVHSRTLFPSHLQSPSEGGGTKNSSPSPLRLPAPSSAAISAFISLLIRSFRLK